MKSELKKKKWKSEVKSENNVKKRPAIKNHVGKSHDEDELVPMVGNKVPKIPRSKRRKFMDQQHIKAQEKEWNRMSVGQMSQLMKRKIPQTIPVMTIEKALMKMMLNSGITWYSLDGLGWPKCICGWVKFPKYVHLVTPMGKKQLFEKQILKINLDILW